MSTTTREVANPADLDFSYDSTPRVGEDTLDRARVLRLRFLVSLPLGVRPAQGYAGDEKRWSLV